MPRRLHQNVARSANLSPTAIVVVKQRTGTRSRKECASLVLPNPDLKPFTAISNNTFLHDRNEEKTFQILIDIIRVRQDDVYVFEGGYMPVANVEPPLCDHNIISSLRVRQKLLLKLLLEATNEMLLT